MSEFTVTIDTGNAAFEGENLEGELARILRKLADDIENNHPNWTQRKLYDVNGNKVGRTTYEE